MITAQIPNVDLDGVVKVIEFDKDDKPHWKTLGRCFATVPNAKRILRKHGYDNGWLDDGFCDRFIVAGIHE